MKAKTMMTLVIAIALWTSAVVLFAEPLIDVNLSNSLPIPHAYDEVIKLESGDLQFYKMTVGDGSIQIAGFQYLIQSNTFTDLVQIGSITGFGGIAFREMGVQRFGKFYTIYQYPRYDPQVLIIIRLDAHEFEYRIIDNMPLYDYYDGFFASNRIDIVSEDHLVIALADRLEFYDFASDTSQTLLDGEGYHCNTAQRKRVYAMPTGHFMYVKDTCGDFTLETWFIFDVQGNLLFTQIMTDPWFCMSVTAPSYALDLDFVHDRFYIPTFGMAFNSALLECHFPCPDSLHVFIVRTPVSADEGLLRLVSFGDDRILRLYIDYDTYDGDYFLYMNYSPLEDNPVYTHWAEFGHINPHIDSINDKIVSISARYEDYIYISALCNLDFPASHTFTFPAPTINIYLQDVITFSHEDQLFMISHGTLYAFKVDFSVSNADETAVPPVHTLSAYPNPVNANNMITFKASLKQATELDIYNIRGQKVDTTSLDSEGTAEWNLRNYKGETVSAGVYFAKPRSNKQIKAIKFIVIHQD